MSVRLTLAALSLALAVTPAIAGHRHAGSDRAIILQNNQGYASSRDNGGIILQNHNKVRGIKNRGGIILQDQNRGGIILQRGYRPHGAAHGG